jgi:3',5'-cyclic AMP phosphodiesterase CpdA
VQAVEVINKPISRPLPTLPEPVINGGTLRVEISANMPSDISALLVSPYDEIPLTLTEGPTEMGAQWILTFTIPDIKPGLYDLHITFNGKDYVQPHSVWAMDDWPESLSITQISDVHQPYGGANFSQFIYEQNLLNPDMILATGDIVEAETIKTAWENLQGTLEYNQVPIYLLAGNHDQISKANLYKQYGGKTNYSLTIGDFFIVGLNSHGGGYVTLEEIAWAEKVLALNPDKVKIIAFHHPLFSGEYVDDGGTLTGGEVHGTWQNIEALESIMYFTWSQNMNNAREILKVIEENDVRLIMAGHIHRDLIYLLNNEHYFITTTTLGGGGFQYRGYRNIIINSDGTVTLDEYGEANKYNPPNSIPLENIKYLYKQANDGSNSAVSAIIENELDMTIDDARLEFIVDSSIDVSSYSFSSDPEKYEVVTSTDGHHFIAYYDIPPKSVFTTTLSTASDTIEPEIELHLPDNYDESTSVFGSITVSDGGWGVETVTASYSTDETTWVTIPLNLEPMITSTIWITSYSEEYHEFTLSGEGEITVKVEATDLAGNSATQQKTISPTEPEPGPDPDPDPEPEPKPETGGGIPLPGYLILIGITLSTLLLSVRRSYSL